MLYDETVGAKLEQIAFKGAYEWIVGDTNKDSFERFYNESDYQSRREMIKIFIDAVRDSYAI